MKKGLGKKLEKIFAAVAFAEAGEHETARQILKEDEPKTEVKGREVLKGRKKPTTGATEPARS